MANSVVDACKSPSKINQVRNISYFLTQRTDFFIFLNQLKQYHLGHFSLMYALLSAAGAFEQGE